MATQNAIAKRQRAFQEKMQLEMSAMASSIEKLLAENEALIKELHETQLAVLRVERKLKEAQE